MLRYESSNYTGLSCISYHLLESSGVDVLGRAGGLVNRDAVLEEELEPRLDDVTPSDKVECRDACVLLQADCDTRVVIGDEVAPDQTEDL